jgi:hypothetical protein
MKKETRNWLIILCVFALPFLIFLGCLISGLTSPTRSDQPLPNPNGYDAFVKAGKKVANDTENSYKMNEAELQTLFEENSNALQVARTGLQMQSRIPIQFSESYMTIHMNELPDLKRLAQAFDAEGKLAEMENRPADAAKSYLDIIHLANESSRGGILIDELVGIAIESIGRNGLQNISAQLDAKTCRESAATLEMLDAQKQTWNDVMQQENAWSHNVFPGIRTEISRIINHTSSKKLFQSGEKISKERQMETRQLIIALAARAYELEKGKSPASVADLVPNYLKAIPQDPFTGTNMIYSP